MKYLLNFKCIVLGLFLVFLYSCKKDDVITKPVISTNTVTAIKGTTAVCGGSITNIGGEEITAKGVCWSISNSPTVSDNYTNDINEDSTYFKSEIKGLHLTTKYFIRAYATNSAGTGYGDTISFTTKEGLTDIDGNEYNIITIDRQTWMAENLKVTHYSDGTPLLNFADSILHEDGYCFYNNNAEGEAEEYGALYTWAAAMNNSPSSFLNPSGVQGVCPDGWHLPGLTEWYNIIHFYGGESIAGDSLKEPGSDHWECLNNNISNSNDFSALPGGYRNYSGNYEDIGRYGVWWSSSQESDATAYVRSLRCYSAEIRNYFDHKANAFSVRCIKD